MMVPRTRLLVAFGLIVVPAALLAPAPGAATPAGIVFALFIAVALLDAVLGRRAGESISLALPAVIRVVRRRTLSLPLTISNAENSRATIRVGMVLPPELPCEQDDFTVDLPQGETQIVTLTCKAPVRGTFPIRSAALQASSPLGLWSRRRSVPLTCEVRVYPDLGGDRRLLASLLVRRGSGLHLQRQVGRGREFETLREYVPGDAINEIHWKATARRSRLVTRTFRIERAQEIYAVIDCSRLTRRPAGEGENILERYVSASLGLALASRQQGDLFGLVTFSDAVHGFVRAGSTHAHFAACRNALLDLKSRSVTPDYIELAATLDSRLRRRAMLVFLTELDDPVLAEDFIRAMQPLIRRHLIAVASVRDDGARPLFELPAATEAQVYERLRGHLAWQRLRETSGRLAALGVRMMTADPARLTLELAQFYRNVRQRQAI